MGAMDFVNYYVGTKSPREAYNELVEEAIYDYGHSGYSGTIKEKSGFTMVSLPEGEKLQDFINEMTCRNDKWGPAYCVELKGADLDSIKSNMKETNSDVRAYIFFGVASS